MFSFSLFYKFRTLFATIISTVKMLKSKIVNSMALVCALVLLPSIVFSCTDEDQFTCKTTGNCIPLEWVCDNVKDCSHGEVNGLFSFKYNCRKLESY